MSGLTKTFTTVTKTGILTLGVDAWDTARSYCSVVVRDGRWHLFYYGLPADESQSFTCYAYSDDEGASWVKPNLGAVSYSGSTANNILLPGALVQVFFDELLAKWVMVRETTTATSPVPAAYISTADAPDGPWSLVKTLDPDGYNEGKSLARRTNGTWVLFYTGGQLGNRRNIGSMVSADGDLAGSWTVGPEVFTSPSTAVQFYSLACSPIADRVLGLVVDYDGSGSGVSVLDLYSVTDPLAGWVKLVDSWVPRGASGAWDDSSLYQGNIAEDGDLWHVFYVGTSEPHDAGSPIGLNLGHGQIPRGRLAAYTGTGTLTTTRLKGDGQALTVNGDATGGSIVVELLDVSGTALPGFSASEFDGIVGDSLDHPCTWDGQGPPAGVYRIRFTLTSATLHGYTTA